MSKHSEFRSGWPELSAAFLGIAIGVSSLYFYTIGLFIEPLEAEFGWSRTAISSVTFFGALTLAASSPLVGALADRFGVRIVSGLSLLAFAGCFFLLSFTTASFAVFLIFSVLLNLFGTGTTPVVFTRLVNQAFYKSRGLALGIALAGTGITGALAPRLVAGFLEQHGWRDSYQLLGWVVLILCPVVFILVTKSKPEKAPSPNQNSTNPIQINSLSFQEARRTKTFWLLCALFFLVSLAIGGVVVHLVPLLTDIGMERKQAATIAGALGASVIVGRVITGFLLDKFFAPRIALILFSITAAGCISLIFGGAQFAVFAAFSVGFSMGAEVDFIGYLVARYFGLKAYGKIYGFLYAIFMIGMSFSPMIVGFIFDTQNSYDYALWLCAFYLVGASIIASLLPAFNIHHSTKAKQ